MAGSEPQDTITKCIKEIELRKKRLKSAMAGSDPTFKQLRVRLAKLQLKSAQQKLLNQL